MIHQERQPIAFPKDVSWHCEQYNSYPNITNPTILHPSITDSNPMDNDIDVAENTSASVLQNTGSGVVAYTGGVCGYNVLQNSEIVGCVVRVLKLSALGRSLIGVQAA
ncbi:MAG: hypothetical protein R2788_00865 [Saprospiraceae bacterium]